MTEQTLGWYTILERLFICIAESYMSDGSCAVGFLHRRSLDLIVDALNDTASFTSSSFQFNQYPLESAQSVPLNESGRVMKIVMAAKFYHSIHSGWPILQIRRRINNSLVVVDMAMSEPRPSGYLNVFEYDMSTDVQAGDIVRIRGSPVTESRYLLAYLNHNGIYKPLLHISMSNLSGTSEATSSTTLAIGNVSNGTTNGFNTTGDDYVPTISATVEDKTDIISSMSSSSFTIMIVGVLTVSCIVIFITPLVIGITLFAVHQYKSNKKSSMDPIYNEVSEVPYTSRSTGECIEMDTNQAYITNAVPAESNVGYSTRSTAGSKLHDFGSVAL